VEEGGRGEREGERDHFLNRTGMSAI